MPGAVPDARIQPYTQHQPRSPVLVKLYSTGSVLLTFSARELGQSCPVLCRRFSSIPDLYPLEASRTLPNCDSKKMYPDIAKCVGAKILLD